MRAPATARSWQVIVWAALGLLVVGLLSAGPAWADGAYVLAAKWGSAGTGDLELLGAAGVAAQPSAQGSAAPAVYVVDKGNDRIQVFSSTGVHLGQWGSKGEEGGQFNRPEAIAVDPAPARRAVYVADSLNQRVEKFTPSGTFVAAFPVKGAGYGQQAYPHGIAVDPSGNVYVAVPELASVQEFSRRGTFIRELGKGEPNVRFGMPWAVACDRAGNVYVADSQRACIQKFSSSGAHLAGWDSSKGFHFSWPISLAVDAANNVYVGDGGLNCVQKFTSAGVRLYQGGTQGTGDGQFQWPNGLAVDARGSVYVADENNDRIQEFASVLPCVALTTPICSTDTSANLSFNISWAASGSGGTDIVSYSLYQSTTSAAGPWTLLARYTKLGKRSITSPSAGRTYYFRVTATDEATKIGAAVNSTVVPYDQTSMSFSGRWATLEAGKGTYYLGSERRSNVKGSSASYHFRGAKEIALIVTQRASGGYAQVFIDSVAVATVNCYATQTRYRVPVVVKNFGTPTSGTLKVVVSGSHQTGSTGDYVELDGVAIKR